MCGIAGFISFSEKQESQSVIERMTNAIKSRGPDNSGIWIDGEHGVYLGHRRLSVIDLSENGSQPMRSSTGRYVITFNGEIYNFCELRKELEGQISISWQGSSDTEVILAAIEHWGLQVAIKKFAGMFAFAIWDRNEKKLHLVRDRLGKKPLYWGHLNGLFLFGSELKALREHKGWSPEINREALAAYMKFGYVPSPNTIYKKICKLMPGSILTVDNTGESNIVSYWKFEDVVSSGLNNRSSSTDDEIISDTENIIEDAVTCRMISDVPLGVFLSGGIDSSLVTALMQKNSVNPVKSFSIGFHEKNYDEAIYAGQVAKHLGTDHTEFYVTANEALDVIPSLPFIYDEPFADSSQIPTYLVSKLTRQHVTVAITGDGGDEIFAGYNRYLYADRLMRQLNSLPEYGRKFLGKIIYSLSPDKWTAALQWLPTRYRIPNAGDKLYKIAEVVGENEYVSYQKLVSHWGDADAVIIGSGKFENNLSHSNIQTDFLSAAESMQLFDALTYLPDDILVKVDRASMAVSLETRAPLLDHRVVEYAWKLPLHMKVRNGKGKWLLRQILHKYISKDLIDRPKAGFSVPIGEWLKGPLRDWAETLLDREKMIKQGYLNPDPIHEKWQEHMSGSRNWQYQIWNVLMFQAWLEYWME